MNTKQVIKLSAALPPIDPRNIPEDASMNDILMTMKQEIETHENAPYSRGEILTSMLNHYRKEFSDDQVYLILNFFTDKERERFIRDLNRGDRWF
jgi:hypothetical protein